MTDTETKRWLGVIVGNLGAFAEGERGEAIRHALQAIEDRAQLCDAIYSYNACGAEHANKTRDTARRHMQGLK